MIRSTKVPYQVLYVQYFTFFNILGGCFYCKKISNFVHVVCLEFDDLVP